MTDRHEPSNCSNQGTCRAQRHTFFTIHNNNPDIREITWFHSGSLFSSRQSFLPRWTFFSLSSVSHFEGKAYFFSRIDHCPPIRTFRLVTRGRGTRATPPSSIFQSCHVPITPFFVSTLRYFSIDIFFPLSFCGYRCMLSQRSSAQKPQCFAIARHDANMCRVRQYSDKQIVNVVGFFIIFKHFVCVTGGAKGRCTRHDVVIHFG